MPFKTSAGAAEFIASYDAALARWPVPFTTMRLPTRFGSTHVIASGPEDGPPVVLLHAAGTGSTVWLHNIAALGQTYRTFLVDVVDEPNKSDWSVPFRSRSDCADWLSDVLDGLNLERTHLGGMSRGGWLSLNFALVSPHRVKSLMLFAPMASFAPTRLSFYFRFFFPMLFPTRARLHRVIKWLSASGRLIDERLADQMFLGIKHFQFPKGGIFPTLFPVDELKRLELPTLLLMGEREVIYEPNLALRRATQFVPGIQAAVIPFAGHLLIAEQAEIVNQRMVDFLASMER